MSVAWSLQKQKTWGEKNMDAPVLIQDIEDIRAFLLNSLRDNEKRRKYMKTLEE